MLCFDLILGPFCIYVQKLSGRAKTFRLAMPTRQRAFFNSVTCQVNRWYDSHCFVVRSFLMEFTPFCCKNCFIAIHAVCCETCFVAIYALSVWRQITPKILSVEKKWQLSCMFAFSFVFVFVVYTKSIILIEAVEQASAWERRLHI